jgi:FMN phosphatase YigB (HAD superfamily)
MVEDLPANLKPAKGMGMTTVLVGQDLRGIQEMDGFVDYEIADILQLKKLLERMGVAIKNSPPPNAR